MLNRYFPDWKLTTVTDVIAFLDQTANGGLKTPGKRETAGELKRVIREARDALREISNFEDLSVRRIIYMERRKKGCGSKKSAPVDMPVSVVDIPNTDKQIEIECHIYRHFGTVWGQWRFVGENDRCWRNLYEFDGKGALQLLKDMALNEACRTLENLQCATAELIGQKINIDGVKYEIVGISDASSVWARDENDSPEIISVEQLQKFRECSVTHGP